MSFPYKNMVQLTWNIASQSQTFEGHMAEMTSECELTAAAATVQTTIASSTANYWTLTLEDGAAGSGSTAMSSALGGISSALTAIVPTAFTISEGTINDGDALNCNFVEAGTATIIPTIDLELVRGLPAGAG